MNSLKSNAEKVQYYEEWQAAYAAFQKKLQEGQYTNFDRDELFTLKSLQGRAVQYILYYTKVCLLFVCCCYILKIIIMKANQLNALSLKVNNNS